MDNMNYETGEVIETYVYRESGHSSIMMWLIGLIVVVMSLYLQATLSSFRAA